MLYLCFHGAALSQSDPLRLVYPRSNMLVSTSDSLLVLGQIYIPNSTLHIEKQSIPLSEDGAFAGYVGLDPAKVASDSGYVLSCRVESKDSVYVLDRKIRIPGPPASIDSSELAVDAGFLFPSDTIWLRSGDRIALKCRATPGVSVFYSVFNSDGIAVSAFRPMVEAEPELMDNFGESVFGIGKRTKRLPAPGIYSADYFFDISLKDARIRFYAVKRADTVYVDALARLNTIQDADVRVIEFTSEFNTASVAPGRAYYYFIPPGIRCASDGRMGSQIRLRLSERHEAWIAEKNVRFLPRATKVPTSFIPLVRVWKEGTQTKIKLIMSEKLPYRIEQTDERTLQLWVFGGISDTDWIRFESEDPDVRRVMWSQPEPDVYGLKVDLTDTHHWGYETEYDGTNLIWTIRHKPKTRGLKGLKVCIDPGHSQDIGATGPRGITERQVNVEVAQALKKELESDGAVVVMTHTDTSQNVSLYERIKIANQNRCDLFVSIHHNAPPDGVSPLNQRFGPSVIYYHPQSRKWAESIQKEMVSKSGLPDFGVFQGNMAVCRNSHMPAVLVECAFLSLPDQEKLIVSPKFQKKMAQAIKAGIKKVLK